MGARIGRPKSENPKLDEVKARIDAQTLKTIQGYCVRHGITRTDFVREGIKLVLAQEKIRQPE